MATLRAPYFPLVYVRGYAMTPAEIADAVSSPYMGFNVGATRLRQAWNGQVRRQVFESPLVRLMKDYGYRDIYDNGTEMVGPVPARSVVIYRYYDSADPELGDGPPPSITAAAQGLRDLIHRLRAQVCGADAQALQHFKVHLVAHSMGGLVCRCFLQNDDISTPEDRALVSKVFTYATPHNGIELAGLNVPALLARWDLNNFSRKVMARYLDLPIGSDRVDSLDGKFDPQRFFCFIGTNHRDYAVALGLARTLAGAMSDGLVQIENAAVQDAPRAFAYRSHSGPYGVVNSEEGYQNLVRFLFGDLRVDGVLEVEALALPPSVQRAKDAGREVRASYYFEATVAPRGANQYALSERRCDTFSAVLRRFDELLQPDQAGRETARAPVLFSVFLDTAKITVGKTVVFSVELAVSTTGYTIDGKLFLQQHVEGEYLFRDTLTVRATPTAQGWNVRYLRTDERWSEGLGTLADWDGTHYRIALSSQKGFRARLRLRLQQVAPDPGAQDAVWAGAVPVA